MTALTEIGASKNVITDRVGNMLLFQGNVERTNEFFVPANHPFNFWTDPDNDGLLTYVAPDDWIPEVHEAVSVGYFGRPLGAEAAGENSGYEKRVFDNLRAMIGVEGDLRRGLDRERLCLTCSIVPLSEFRPSLDSSRICECNCRGHMESFWDASSRS